MDDIPVRQLRNGSNGKDIREVYDLEDIKYRITKYYFLNFTKDYKAKSNASYKFWVDGREFDITETTDYQLIKPEHIPEIILGDGVCLDISIQRREIEYDVETKDRDVKKAKTAYTNQLDKVENIITTKQFKNNSAYESELLIEKNKLKTLYDSFIKELERALKEKEVLAE